MSEGSRGDRYETGDVHVFIHHAQDDKEHDEYECPLCVAVPGYVRYESEVDETSLIYLPHQCDEWIIGNVDDAKRMILDLQNAVAELEARR